LEEALTRILKAGALLLVISVCVRAQRTENTPPLSIARQGYLFAGEKYSTVNDRQVMSGQIYAEYQIPVKRTKRWPVLMIHGLWQSGTNFTATADGREGWAVRAGG